MAKNCSTLQKLASELFQENVSYFTKSFRSKRQETSLIGISAFRQKTMQSVQRISHTGHFQLSIESNPGLFCVVIGS